MTSPSNGMGMKIWHDDIRRPPEGWLWARTNDEAKAYLTEYHVNEIDMDHDMGLHDLDPDAYVQLDGATAHASFLAGRSEDNGMKLVVWMIRNDLVPPKVTIHSWNPGGANNMAFLLNQFGYDCEIAPFKGTR